MQIILYFWNCKSEVSSIFKQYVSFHVASRHLFCVTHNYIVHICMISLLYEFSCVLPNRWIYLLNNRTCRTCRAFLESVFFHVAWVCRTLSICSHKGHIWTVSLRCVLVYAAWGNQLLYKRNDTGRIYMVSLLCVCWCVQSDEMLCCMNIHIDHTWIVSLRYEQVCVL